MKLNATAEIAKSFTAKRLKDEEDADQVQLL